MSNSRKMLIGGTLLLLSQASSAAIVSSTVENVSILGNNYNVTFWADDTSYDEQSYNNLSSYGDALTFSSESAATYAIEAIIDAAGEDFDFNPGYYSNEYFRVAYMLEDGTYDYMTWAFGTINGSFSSSISTGNAFSLATFETAPVPLPAGIWLMATGLTGLAVSTRKRKPR